MPSFIPFPFFLSNVFIFLWFCKPKFNKDFMNPVVPYVFPVISINHSFQSVCRHPVSLISVLNNFNFPLLNHFYWMAYLLPYFRDFSYFIVYLSYLINPSDRYTCCLPCLVDGLAII